MTPAFRLVGQFWTADWVSFSLPLTLGLNGEIGYPGQETERGTWYGGIVVYPDHLETYWDVKVRLERNNRLALADALVAADGRAIVGMQARMSAVAAGCAVTAGGCAAYGLYSAKKDYDAGNTKMAAAGLALTALGAGAVTAELRGVRAATAEVQAVAVETQGAIGATGKVGETVLKALGGESQVYFRTSLGGRYVDQLIARAAHESKVGYTTLSSDIRLQISKDAELLQTARIDSATWHFFKSPVTGVGGPSQPLRDLLQQSGINVIVH